MKKAKATKPGTCVKCKKPYLRGERIFWTQPVHQSCLHGAFSSIPPAPTLEMTRLVAMAALEEAEVAAAENGVEDAVEKMWERYEKLKAMALQPGSKQEETQAFRMALLKLVEIAYWGGER
jgi:hypothetical protein